MKRNKGFTLIELLAVIVILAIIALIAVPLILNIINRSRKAAIEDSAYALRSAAKMYYATSITENPQFNEETFTCNGRCLNGDGKELELDGKIPTNGTIKITAKGKITYTDIEYDNYKCDIPEKGKINCYTGAEPKPPKMTSAKNVEYDNKNTGLECNDLNCPITEIAKMLNQGGV